MKDILFRCSGLGDIMTNERGKTTMGETAKTNCIEVYAEHEYSRRDEIHSKYMEKGVAMEEDSLTLVSMITGDFYRKNEDCLTNEFLSGHPDVKPKNDKGIELKTSWSLNTFLKAKHSKLKSDYYWQVMGYMALTGAKEWDLCYCLVNSTADLITDAKRKLAYSMRVMDNDTDPAYVEGCKLIERNMIFDLSLFLDHNPHFELRETDWKYDIPASERLHRVTIERDEDAIQKIYDRVTDCRNYINQTFYNVATSRAA